MCCWVRCTVGATPDSSWLRMALMVGCVPVTQAWLMACGICPHSAQPLAALVYPPVQIMCSNVVAAGWNSCWTPGGQCLLQPLLFSPMLLTFHAHTLAACNPLIWPNLRTRKRKNLDAARPGACLLQTFVTEIAPGMPSGASLLRGPAKHPKLGALQTGCHLATSGGPPPK